MNKIVMTVVLMLVGCTPSLEQASSRDPSLFEKNVTVMSRPIGAPSKNPEIYIKRQAVEIAPVAKSNDTGSLYNPEDERNNLFTTAFSASPGRYLTIQVRANRSSKEATEPKDEKEKTPQEVDQELQELLTALPELEPEDAAKAMLVRSFKVKVMHRYDNGDALIMMVRRSEREEQALEISVEARIPYDRLTSGDTLTTGDLTEVKFVESGTGELIDRRSSGWEDEYTLRLSGFTEVKSKYAMALQDKKTQLDDVKKRLENKINAFGNERRTLSKERQDMAEKSATQRDEVAKLNDTIKKQEEQIAEQDKQIKELSLESKPGDQKDGADGE